MTNAKIDKAIEKYLPYCTDRGDLALAVTLDIAETPEDMQFIHDYVFKKFSKKA